MYEKRLAYCRIMILIALFSVQKAVASDVCLSSAFSNRECLNNSTCVRVPDEDPICSCDLPYEGINCEKCLCFSINRTCSIYGDSICMSSLSSSSLNSTSTLNKASSYSGTPLWYFFVGTLELWLFCLCGFFYCFCNRLLNHCLSFKKFLNNMLNSCDQCIKCILNLIESLCSSLIKKLILICECKCCNSTSSDLPTSQPVTHQTNLNNSTILNQPANEQIIINPQIIERNLIKTIRQISCYSIIDDDLPSCVICFSSLNNSKTAVETIYCGHIFHKDCIKNWFNEIPNNPICPFRCNREPNIERLNSTNISDDSPSCVICYRSLNSTQSVKSIYCGHTFHDECIENWFNERPSNPICPFRCNRETNIEPLDSVNTNVNFGSSSCVICFKSLVDSQRVTTIYCGHTFHDECIENWFNERPSNPTCPYRCFRETNRE